MRWKKESKSYIKRNKQVEELGDELEKLRHDTKRLSATRTYYEGFFDYAFAHNGRNLKTSSKLVRCGYEVSGAERILFSTDYPWGPEAGQERLRTYPQVIRSIGISSEEQELIFEGNIRSILGI